MNRHVWAWSRFQRRTGWIFGPGETALCIFALTVVILFGADAVRAYFRMMVIVGHWMAGGTP